MTFTKTKQVISLIVILVFFVSPLLAQQKRNATPRKPAAAPIPEPTVTFDSLLSADSYKIYSEVRNVGQLIRSAALNDVLEPVIKLARPPKEFKAVWTWLNVHADALAGSRLLIAGWPSRPKLPSYLMAIEFSSPEEAKKFESGLRGFLPTLLPAPTPASSPRVGPPTHTTSATKNPEKEPEDQASLPPYQIKQSGSLVLISDIAFNVRDLKPRGSRSLEDDQDFTLARNRFASESFFLFVDLKSIEKEEKERRQKWEDEEQKRIEIEAANASKVQEVSTEAEASMNVPAEGLSSEEPPPPQPAPSVSGQVVLGTTSEQPQLAGSATVLTSADPAASADSEAMSGAFISLYSALFGGEAKWPEAIGAAITFEGDAYVVRTMIVNGAENKINAIPFIPQFVSGPAFVPEAANVFPADVDLFATASLDYPQIYDGMVKAMARAEELSRKYRKQSATSGAPASSPFALYEKKLGLKIKEDLLPLLGNELAFALPGKAPVESASPNPDKPPAAESVGPMNHSSAESNPIVAIAVKDKEAVKRLIPKLIESLAFKGANLFAQTEKLDGTEIISYANMFSYAFIGDFLVISPDPALTRHLVDSYLNHQTLSSDGHYRNSTRWQPRQVLGQIYVAPDLMERYYPSGSSSGAGSDKLREFLERLNPVIDPMTYALTDDGLGPLHELHVPRSLLMLMIAGMSSEVSQSPLVTNEATAKGVLRTIFVAEATYKETKGSGHYGTIEELITEGLIAKEMMEKYGYRVELSVSGNKFEATAIPVEYGKTGKLSYFVDETGILRGGDHGGGAATISDNQIQ
jgi:hypothetical protein